MIYFKIKKKLNIKINNYENINRTKLFTIFRNSNN